MTGPVYTARVLNVIGGMIKSGKSNKEIAMAIGTTERRLASRLHQLGMRRRRPDMSQGYSSFSIRLPHNIATLYADAAQARNMTVRHLIRTMIAQIADDNLFSAILDDK